MVLFSWESQTYASTPSQVGINVCVCVCVRARARVMVLESEREREKERKREREREKEVTHLWRKLNKCCEGLLGGQGQVLRHPSDVLEVQRHQVLLRADAKGLQLLAICLRVCVCVFAGLIKMHFHRVCMSGSIRVM